MTERWEDADLTPLFPHWKKPHRTGMYMVRWQSQVKKDPDWPFPQVVEEGFAWFDVDKGLWGWTGKMLDSALQEGSTNARQDKHWRGLTPAAWGRIMAERIK